MTRAQQIELSRQELVNTLSAGIWFENMLNQALLRNMMHQDPTARATHYELTELGDETRHMVMFGKAIERVGAKPVRPRLYQRMIINALPLAFKGFAAVGSRADRRGDLRLAAAADDGRSRAAANGAAAHAYSRHRGGAPHPVCPRRVTQARPEHAANQQVVGGQPQRRRWRTSSSTCSPTRCPTAASASTPSEARRVARSSPHRHEVQVAGFAPLAAFLEEVGLMGPIARRMWKRSRFL